MRTEILTLLCLCVIIASSCSSQKETDIANNQTIISGKVYNRDVYPNTESLTVHLTDFRNFRSVFNSPINEDGSFHLTFNLYSPQDIGFNPVGNRMILHPGDSLFVEIDFRDIGNFRYSGDRAETNLALQKYLSSNTGAFTFEFFSSQSSGLEERRRHCDSIRVDALEKRRVFIERENPPADFKQWSLDYINIQYYRAMLSNLSLDAILDEGFINWFNTIQIGDLYVDRKGSANRIVNSGIFHLANSYERILVRMLVNSLPEGGVLSHEDVFEVLLEKEDGIFKELLIGNVFHNIFRSFNLTQFNDYKHIFEKNINESFIKQPLLEFYQIVKNPELTKAISDPIFSNMGSEGRSLMESIIAENRGKVLFVDLWATWCKPCIMGMEAMKDVMPLYEDEEIEFIYLCIRSTEENWAGFLAENDIGGRHYFANQEQSTDISIALGVNAIPHYFVIGKEGYIVKQRSFGFFHSKDLITRLLDSSPSKL
ncbi:TlpA family protein disulfide reductase [Natronoflexus pectinivorans]|uniref:Thiol-disulfide isomerase/thioredoxin n=1 Tax=Natronoflexus pectinivorans TaxID=682526 RepID=A0A4R2GGC1_9BACT|nr:TlpA disulfide reductase family protein [Natronoflexus pectinivorans]TCO07295.1 thiol-disulfide isomerase/thioredoxin [Natronoflexus pectinivorans]